MGEGKQPNGWDAEYEVRGAWCQMCGPAQTNCYTRCYLKDGVWERVEGCPQAGNNGIQGSVSLCAKGNAAPELLKTKGRLLYPLRRIGPKGPGAKFERISWDEALDAISSTLLDQKEKYGAESFGILSPQHFQVLANFGRRFLNVHGSPNYLHSGICHIQRHTSANTVLGGPTIHASNTTVPVQMDKTELLVCWGANPENAGVNLGRARREVHNLQRGMKLVDIRPMCDALASKADVWLPVRPGTDLALALGMLHVIIGEDLYDHEFVENWCYGFDRLAEHVKQFAPEWASQRCGIPAEQIAEVARMIAAAKPAAILFGNGVGDQARDGHWTVCCIELIGALCGNIGKAGGGTDGRRLPPLIDFSPIPRILPDRLPRSQEDVDNGWPAGASKLVAPEFPRWLQPRGAGGPTSSYLRGLQSVLTGKPYPLRGIFAQSTNPLSATRDPELVARALEKLDFFFVMDTFYNPSCDYADIVLPAATAYECSDQVGFRNTPAGTFLGINQKLQDPPGEAISDWEFYLRLACKMGYGEDFWNGDIEGYLAELLADTGYTADDLRAMPDGVFVPREDKPAGPGAGAPAGPNYERMFGGLPHGKVQCVNESMGNKPDIFDVDLLSDLPVYRGPAEGIAETPELAQDYPLAFSDVHAHRMSQHGYFSNMPSVRAFTPDPWVRMHPSTAQRYGIADGDWVRVESPHGSCILRAQLFEGISPDVLMARRGWWQPCPELGLAGFDWHNDGAETNVLYSSDPEDADRFHSAHGKQTLVRIERVDGPRYREESDIEARWVSGVEGGL